MALTASAGSRAGNRSGSSTVSAYRRGIAPTSDPADPATGGPSERLLWRTKTAVLTNAVTAACGPLEDGDAIKSNSAG